MRSEPKYAVGDRVIVCNWTGGRIPATVEAVDWVYHHRMYEHVWGYRVKTDGGVRTGLTMIFIPEGYLRPEEGEDGEGQT